jgi:hypothetical protein
MINTRLGGFLLKVLPAALCCGVMAAGAGQTPDATPAASMPGTPIAVDDYRAPELKYAPDPGYPEEEGEYSREGWVVVS